MNVLYANGKIIAQYPDDNEEVRRTNCKNCGAPLPLHGKCIYCETENSMEAWDPAPKCEIKQTASEIVMTCCDPWEPFKRRLRVRDQNGAVFEKVIDLV